ncbi:G patch domain and ankyrin repeat-containing protein 1 homolog [Zophobas morio]|uniref:G patch domain and ankyrin repeat-containing protein 1 homolog n=1 Tax=Zophobas morio TaxID=2755281 RepID=UPI003082E9D1
MIFFNKIKDDYDWTLLMVASVAGNIDIVNYLLKKGVDVHHQDNQGRNCYQLALQTKQHTVCQALEEFVCGPRNLAVEDKGSTSNVLVNQLSLRRKIALNNLRAKCKICNEHMSLDFYLQKHRYTAIHLFNLNKNNPSEETLNFPVSSLGYKLLKKEGWSEVGGLGSSGQGILYPIKTMLKRDKLGLGVKTKSHVKRITHFKPGDISAIKDKNPFKKELVYTKKKLQKCEELQKKKEIEIRRCLNEL